MLDEKTDDHFAGICRGGSAWWTVTGQKLVRLPKEMFPFQGIVELTLAAGNPVRAELAVSIFNPTYYFAEIPFAASDVNTEFVGLVEAVDGTGQIGAQTFSFRVYK